MHFRTVPSALLLPEALGAFLPRALRWAPWGWAHKHVWPSRVPPEGASSNSSIAVCIFPAQYWFPELWWKLWFSVFSCLCNLGDSSLPCDLMFLMDLRRAVDCSVCAAFPCCQDGVTPDAPSTLEATPESGSPLHYFLKTRKTFILGKNHSLFPVVYRHTLTNKLKTIRSVTA